MLGLTDGILEYKHDVDEREEVGLESDGHHENEHNQTFNHKDHSFVEADFVLHVNGILQDDF